MEPVTFGMAGFSLMSGMGEIGLYNHLSHSNSRCNSSYRHYSGNSGSYNSYTAAAAAAAAATVSMPLWLPVAGVAGRPVGPAWAFW